MLRKICYEIHLWLGIVSGIVVFLVCLSGTILTFREEIERFSKPTTYYVTVPKDAAPLPVNDIITKLETANPTMKVASITIPEQPNRTIAAMFTTPMPEATRGERSGDERQGGRRERGEGGERQGGHGERGEGGERRTRTERPNPANGDSEKAAVDREKLAERGQQGNGGHARGFGKTFYVNPYTAEVVGESEGRGGSPFFMSMLQLHRNLWITTRISESNPRATLGGLIVGIATIIFVVVVISGFVLWLPRTLKGFTLWKAWKTGLKVRLRKGFWLFVYDSHNTIGFYMLIPTLILALTGLCWSFSWYRDKASVILGDQIFKGRMQRPEKIKPIEDEMKPFSVGEMIERQNKLTPGQGEVVVSIPGDNETAMVIQKGRTGFFALSVKDKTQWDRFRGTVIPVEHFGKTVEVERFADKPFGAKIASTIRSLHLGDITGTSSKILFFVACLFATSFPVTGVILWIKKLVIRHKKRKSVADIVS